MVTWDSVFETVPSVNEERGLGAGRIRDIKTAVRERLEKEHYFDLAEAGTQPRQGLHKPGSAIAFWLPYPPSYRNGVALGADDAGLLWLNSLSRVLYEWTGTEWKGITAAAVYVAGATPSVVGHASGDIPISDGTLCANLNADLIEGIRLSAPGAGTYNSATVAAGGVYTIPEGLGVYMYDVSGGTLYLEIKDSGGTWRRSGAPIAGSLFLSDGVNYRVANTGASSATLRWRTYL